MSSLASLTSLAIKLKRRAKHSHAQSRNHSGDALPFHLPSLPTSLTDAIPLELFELILTHLAPHPHDRPALLACSLVCRAWLPKSRILLRASLPVWPAPVLALHRADAGAGASMGSRPAWPGSCVNCATANARTKDGEVVYFGTDAGVFRYEPGPNRTPTLVLSHPDVTQVDVLDDYNLFIFLSARQILTAPLDMLDAALSPDSVPCTRVSSQASFFKVGKLHGRTSVCRVKSGLTSTIKILEPSVVIPGTMHSKPRCKLRIAQELYISEKATSVHFLRTKLVAATSHHGFELMDLETTSTQSLLHPDVRLPYITPSTKCLSVHRVDNEFLLCYDTVSVYINSQGLPSRPVPIVWNSPLAHTVLREPYLVGFTQKQTIEVRHVETGELLQATSAPCHILCATPELLMLQTRDNEIIRLVFSD